MLPPRLPVHDHAQVVLEIAPLGGHHEPVLPRDVRYPLTLIAARLHVLLERHSAPRPEAIDVLLGHFVIREVVLTPGVVGVQRIARAEDARADERAGFDHLRGRKHVLRPHRVVHARRHAEGQRHRRLERLRGDDSTELAEVMRVHVHEAGDDRLAARVDLVFPVQHAGADARDTPLLHDDRSALDHAAVVERDDARAGERHGALGQCARQPQVDLHGVGFARGDIVRDIPRAAAEFDGHAVAPVRKDAALPADPANGETAALLVDVNGMARAPVGGERDDVDIVALVEGGPPSIGRRDDLVGKRK